MRVSQHFMVIGEKKAAMDEAKETASASTTPSAKRRPAEGRGARGESSTKSRKSPGGVSVSGGGGGGERSFSSSSFDDDDDDKENDEDDDDGGEWTTQRLIALGSEIKIWDKLMDIYDGDAAVATADPALAS